MRSERILICEFICTFFFYFLDRERFLFDVFLELKHSKSLFSKNANQGCIRVGIKQNFDEVMILFANNFNLSFTFHSLWIPKAEQGLALIIFIGD